MLSDNKAFNTLSQAIGRVKHYKQDKHPENTIKLYCDSNILNYTLGEELVDMEEKDLNISQRVGKTVTKGREFIFTGYVDNYTTPSTVLDSEWMKGDPNFLFPESRARYLSINDKWCHYDKKVRYWDDEPPGAGSNHAQHKSVLQYESPLSDRFIIRQGIFKRNNSFTSVPKVDFVTSEKSMYA